MTYGFGSYQDIMSQSGFQVFTHVLTADSNDGSNSTSKLSQSDLNRPLIISQKCSTIHDFDQ